MASAGIVPAVGALLRQFGGHLIELNLQVRLQVFQHGTQRGAHNAAADQDDIRILNMLATTHERADNMGKKRGQAKQTVH